MNSHWETNKYKCPKCGGECQTKIEVRDGIEYETAERCIYGCFMVNFEDKEE